MFHPGLFLILLGLCTVARGLVLGSGDDLLVQLEQERRARLELETRMTEMEHVVSRLDTGFGATCAVHCPASLSVAFYAQLSTTLHNPAVGHVVVFDDVITNVGHAYNNVHGIFTAPVNGTYTFNLVVSSAPDPITHQLHFAMKRNSILVGYIFSDANSAYWIRRSTSITLQLAKDDEVWTEVEYSIGNNSITGGHFHTHVSGFLIHQDA